MKNLTVTQKIITAGVTFALAGTIVGCASQSKAKEEQVSTSAIEQTYSNKSEQNPITEYLEQEDPSSAVEEAITLMVEGAENVSEASEKTKESEAYQEAKEETLENFITLSEFLQGDAEIAGYTIDEVKESTVEFAEDSWQELDSDLEKIYPDYKQKLKEKGVKFLDWLEDKSTDVFAWGYNKYQDIKEKTLEKARNK